VTSKIDIASLLCETTHIIQWAISLVPAERVNQPPPHANHPRSDKGFKTYFGDWSALHQVFHLAYYEKSYAIPGIQSFIDEAPPSNDLIFPSSEQETRAFQDALAAGVDLPTLLQSFLDGRELQLQLLTNIPEEVWQKDSLHTGLGDVSAEFIVSKTIQHSLEHANDILKNALYWERALSWLDRQAVD